MEIMDPLAEDGNHTVVVTWEKLQQRILNRKALHHSSPSPATVTRFEYDEEAQRRVETIFAGDPGDETGN